MIYNIDGNVLASPYSLFVSILLCLGVISLGNIIQNVLIKKRFFTGFNEINYFFSPIIGTYSLIIFLYFFVIFEMSSKLILSIFAYSIILLFFLNLKRIDQNILFDKKS